MAKYDNPEKILNRYRYVKLECDGEMLELRFQKAEDYENGVWFINNTNTGLQSSSLYENLNNKYKNIKVSYKRCY